MNKRKTRGKKETSLWRKRIDLLGNDVLQPAFRKRKMRARAGDETRRGGWRGH
jgi:hypothetical protein